MDDGQRDQDPQKMIDYELIALLSSLFIVAILYSSVGHGGASGYLAVMALFSIPVAFTRPTALILNVVVSSIASLSFWRAGHFKREIFLPVALASVPMAFIGGMIELPKEWYQRVLGAGLFFASFRLAWKFSRLEEIEEPRPGILLCVGATIGLVSGLIGIGGGVFLTPLLLLMRWSTAKTAAAISAVFILLNSVAGLAGVYSRGVQLPDYGLLWIAVAIIGGLIGSQLGSRYFNTLSLRRTLAGVLVIAAFKLVLV